MEKGKKAKAIWFDDGGCVHASGDIIIITHNEFHGDHDLDWMLVMEGAREVSRHNAKYITSIVWEE